METNFLKQSRTWRSGQVCTVESRGSHIGIDGCGARNPVPRPITVLDSPLGTEAFGTELRLGQTRPGSCEVPSTKVRLRFICLMRSELVSSPILIFVPRVFGAGLNDGRAG